MTRKLVMAVLLLGLAGSCSFAAGSGLFIGAGAGYSSQELSISTTNFKDNTTAWKVFVGHAPMKFFSYEAGYIDFGSAEDQSIKLDTTGWTLELTGTIPLGSFIEIYGKGGYLWWDSKATSSGSSDTTSGSDWIYGAGAKLIIAKKLGLRLEYEKYDIADTKSVYLVSAGFEWRF
jgi:OmpA-OmpF porin, OOP family